MSPTPLAETAAKTVVLMIVGAVVLGGLFDLYLLATGGVRASISDWLRTPAGSAWFWEPAWAMLCFLLWLAVHLFFLPGGKP